MLFVCYRILSLTSAPLNQGKSPLPLLQFSFQAVQPLSHAFSFSGQVRVVDVSVIRETRLRRKALLPGIRGLGLYIGKNVIRQMALLCLVCFLHEVSVPCPDSLMCRQAKHLASTDVRRLLYLLTWSLWSASGCLLPNLCQVFAHERQSESSYSNLCAAVNTVLVARAKRHWVQKTLVARRRVRRRPACSRLSGDGSTGYRLLTGKTSTKQSSAFLQTSPVFPPNTRNTQAPTPHILFSRIAAGNV